MFELSTEVLLRTLLFVLVFFMVFEGMKRVIKDRKIAGVIGFSVSLIASFFITNDQLNTLFSNMGTLGIIVLIGFPFIIAFFFIYTINIKGIFRKLFWIAYGIMTIAILISSENINTDISANLTILFSAIFIILITMDNWIKKQFNFKHNAAGIRR